MFTILLLFFGILAMFYFIEISSKHHVEEKNKNNSYQIQNDGEHSDINIDNKHDKIYFFQEMNNQCNSIKITYKKNNKKRKQKNKK
jgi:hypothetical protein